MALDRVCVVFGPKGDIIDVVADEPLKVVLVDQSLARERLFLLENLGVGRELVEKYVRGLPLIRWTVGRDADQL